MHSSRMRTTHSLIVSPYVIISHTCPPPICHACPPFTTHTPLLPCMPAPFLPCMPPFTIHTPLLPHMPPYNHAHPLAIMHAPLPATTHIPYPLATMHAPPPAITHTPWQPCMPPSGQTDTCKNITFANFICGQ